MEDFNEMNFKAIIDYQSRNRRFGGIESLSHEFEDSYYPSNKCLNQLIKEILKLDLIGTERKF